MKNLILICMLAMLFGCSHAGMFHQTSQNPSGMVVEVTGVPVDAVPVAKVETAKSPVVPITSIKEVIMFEYDDSSILPNEMTKIERIADLMVKYSDTKISLNGYASIEGGIDYNNNLSTERALSVKAMLVELGVNSDRIDVKGLGETDIFGDLEQNRRVVVE